jgi:hypothetical protein
VRKKNQAEAFDDLGDFSTTCSMGLGFRCPREMDLSDAKEDR